MLIVGAGAGKALIYSLISFTSAGYRRPHSTYEGYAEMWGEQGVYMNLFFWRQNLPEEWTDPTHLHIYICIDEMTGVIYIYIYIYKTYRKSKRAKERKRDQSLLLLIPGCPWTTGILPSPISRPDPLAPPLWSQGSGTHEIQDHTLYPPLLTNTVRAWIHLIFLLFHIQQVLYLTCLVSSYEPFDFHFWEINFPVRTPLLPHLQTPWLAFGVLHPFSF